SMTEELFTDAAKALCDSVKESVSKVKHKSVEAAIGAILDSNRVFVYGVGRSGLVGKAFAMRLVQMGMEAYFIGETITPIVKEGDVVVIISNTGATMSAVQTANIVRRVGGQVIVFTANTTSKLSHASSMTVCIPVKNGVPDPLAPLGTKFEDATLLVLDSMIAVLMKRKGETEESMRKRHAILV
ncbi:MAG: SIS domain-containing protein, partial [Candidatus Thermoplasmatota archaeon]|nr:SIS domain-containing protein [Candidatus Thermoplasmatota archaeon]